MRLIAKRPTMFPVVLCLLGLLAGLDPALAETEQTPPIQTDMVRMFSALASVLPLSFDNHLFSQPDREARIKKSLQTLSQVSHKIPERNIPVDPMSKLIVRGLREDVDDAIMLFSKGEKESARIIVRDLTTYCIGCHTSTQLGKRNFPSNTLAEELAGLTSFEKANFYAASRQYGEAIKEYEYALIDLGKSEALRETWITATKRLMAITVRVRNDPFLALELVARLRESDAFPPSLSPTLAQWRQAIKRWRNEKPAPATPQGQLDLARTLVLSGEQANQREGIDAGLIDMLRASAIINTQLDAVSHKGQRYSELLFLGGKTSEAIDAYNFWTPHNYYYEACIRSSPHSNIAAQCFEALGRLSRRQGAENPSSASNRKNRMNELAKLVGSKL